MLKKSNYSVSGCFWLIMLFRPQHQAKGNHAWRASIVGLWHNSNYSAPKKKKKNHCIVSLWTILIYKLWWGKNSHNLFFFFLANYQTVKTNINSVVTVWGKIKSCGMLNKYFSDVETVISVKLYFNDFAIRYRSICQFSSNESRWTCQ